MPNCRPSPRPRARQALIDALTGFRLVMAQTTALTGLERASDDIPDPQSIRDAAGDVQAAARDYAEQVGDLRQLWQGMDAVYDGPRKTALLAALDGSAGVDHRAIADTTHLNVALDDHGRPAVYATLASRDHIAPIGGIGGWRYNPAHEGWGAYVFSSDGWGYIEADPQSYNTIIPILEGRADEIDFDH